MVTNKEMIVNCGGNTLRFVPTNKDKMIKINDYTRFNYSEKELKQRAQKSRNKFYNFCSTLNTKYGIECKGDWDTNTITLLDKFGDVEELSFIFPEYKFKK